MEYFTLANGTLYVMDEGELGTVGYISELPQDLHHLTSYLQKHLTNDGAKTLSIIYRIISRIGEADLNNEYVELLKLHTPIDEEENE